MLDLSHAARVFEACVSAIHTDVKIGRQGSRDGEFHLQDWFKRQLETLGVPFESPGRNGDAMDAARLLDAETVLTTLSEANENLETDGA